MIPSNGQELHRRLVNEDFLFNAKHFITCLSPYELRRDIESTFWHATDLGELYLLTQSGAKDSNTVTNPPSVVKSTEMVHLENLESIVVYVKDMAEAMLGHEDWRVDQVRSVVGLAIYPGYFAETENEDNRSRVSSGCKLIQAAIEN